MNDKTKMKSKVRQYSRVGRWGGEGKKCTELYCSCRLQCDGMGTEFPPLL